MSTRNLADEDLTNAVLASFAGAGSERFKTIAESLVRHLHAFASEVQLTRGGVVRGDRLPHPHGPHHRRQAAGVRAAVRRARALDAGGGDQQPAPAGGDGVDGLRPVLRRGLAARSRTATTSPTGFSGEPCFFSGRVVGCGRRAGRRCARRDLAGRRCRVLRRPERRGAQRPRTPVHRRGGPVLVPVGQARGLSDPVRRAGR